MKPNIDGCYSKFDFIPDHHSCSLRINYKLISMSVSNTVQKARDTSDAQRLDDSKCDSVNGLHQTRYGQREFPSFKDGRTYTRI